MRRILGLFVGTFIVTAPAWALRYHYLLSSGAPRSSAVAPVTFSFYWESDTLLFPPAPACTGEINAETLPNYTATVSNPGFTVNSIVLCYGTSSQPLGIGIGWTYPGGSALFFFFSKGTPGVETYDENLISLTSTPPLASIDDYPAATLWITDTWVAPVPTVPVCTLCTLHVFITAGPVVPAPGTPVEATIALTSLSGTPIVSPRNVQIVPGQVTPVDFGPGALLSAAAANSTHQDLIPVVTLVNAPSTSPPLQVTTETSILKGAGRQLISGGVSVPPSTLAPQSIGAGQVMRLIATATPPNSCVATMGFASATGAAIGPSLAIVLSPGQSQPLDLDAGALSLQIGQQAIIQPVVQLATAPPPSAAANGAGPINSACSVTSEVVETATGLTLTYQNAFLQ